MGKALPVMVWVASLLPLVSGYRAGMGLTSSTVWKTQPTGPRLCRANWDVHIWVEHKEKCQKTSSDKEMLGCKLLDFNLKGFLSVGTEVHWYGGAKNQTSFYYGDSKEGSCGEAYHMPDYCSRAIISELSTVYDGHYRTTSLMAGAKVLFKTKDESCGNVVNDHNVDQIYQDTLVKEHKGKACWNMAQDWRKLWCSKYARCSCDLSNGDCLSDKKVQCCRDMYQLFLDGHPDERNLVEKHIRRSRTIRKIARTSFSVFAMMELDGFLMEREIWLRICYRAVSVDGFPTVFLEYSNHATFLIPEDTIDLCKYETKMPQYTSTPPNLGFILALVGNDSMSHEFKLNPREALGPSLIGEVPKTDQELVAHIKNLVLRYCD